MYIIFILLLGLVLRIISLNQSLWLDEATTAMAAKMSLTDLFTKFLPGDFHPPLYYLIIKYWTALFGVSEISLRFPSVIFGLGAIYFTYLIGKKIFNTKVGLVSALLLSTSGLAIYYSQEARMYSMAMFLVIVAVYLFIKEKWLYFSIALALIGMTDYIALLILLVFWIMGFKKKTLSLRSWSFIIAHIPLLLSFSVWFSVFVSQLSVGLSVKESVPAWWGILGTLTLKNLLLFPIKFVIGRISFDDPSVYALILIPIFTLFLYVAYKALKISRIIWLWLLVPIAVGILISIKIPTLTYFRFLFCLPALYMLMGYGLGQVGKTKFKILLTAMVVVNLGSSIYYLFNPKFHREDWRGLVSYVEQKKTTYSVTLFPADSNTEAYRYYAPNAKITGPGGITENYDQVWLMTYLSDVFDPEGRVKSKVESAGYHLIKGYNYNGVGILEYLPN